MNFFRILLLIPFFITSVEAMSQTRSDRLNMQARKSIPTYAVTSEMVEPKDDWIDIDGSSPAKAEVSLGDTLDIVAKDFWTSMYSGSCGVEKQILPSQEHIIKIAPELCTQFSSVFSSIKDILILKKLESPAILVVDYGSKSERRITSKVYTVNLAITGTLGRDGSDNTVQHSVHILPVGDSYYIVNF